VVVGGALKTFTLLVIIFTPSFRWVLVAWWWISVVVVVVVVDISKYQMGRMADDHLAKMNLSIYFL
jgi:hypothetical protein